MLSELERRLSGLPEEGPGDQSPPAINNLNSPRTDQLSLETTSVETTSNFKDSQRAPQTPPVADVHQGSKEFGVAPSKSALSKYDAGYFAMHRPHYQRDHFPSSRESLANNSSTSLRAHDEHTDVSALDEAALSTAVQGEPPSGRLAKHHRHSLSHTKSSSESHISPPVPLSNTAGEYPVYPNQSYSVLQNQVYPSRAPPLLRTRSSHPSQFSLYTDSSQSSLRQGRDRASPSHGSRTAGNTPASSPGLFSPRSSRSTPPASLPGDDPANTSPFLHPTHMQTPKETHTAEVDFDPMTGNKLINNYEVLEELGRGEHGKVKLGRDLKTGQKVAIKIVPRFSNKRRLGKLGAPEDKVKKEVAILKKARHPNVVSLLEVIDDPNRQKVYIVLEYVEKGEIIWRKKGLKEIIVADKRRIQREKTGVPETLETLETDQLYVKAVQARRHQKELLEAQQASRPVPGWSLEHGTDSDDETSAEALRTLSRTTDQVGSDTQPTGISSDRSSLRDDVELEASDNFLQGTMYGAYVPEVTGRGRHMSLALSYVSHQSSEIDWDEEDDEMSYVPCLTISEARNAFRDTLLGLEFLHFQGIIHRDIKPANLLIASNNHVKVSDFGVSYLGRPVRDDDDEAVAGEDVTALDDPRELSKTVGTPAFFAPELCYTDAAMFEGGKEGNGPKITGALDLWSLGVTLYGMIFGRLPFLADNEYGMFTKIVEAQVEIPDRRLKAVEDKLYSREGSQVRVDQVTNSNKRPDEQLAYEVIDETLKDLLGKLLVKDPAKRITIKGAKLHPWVTADLGDPEAWYKSSAPDQYGAKKIEVSKEEVAGAVTKTSFVERVRSAMGRLGGLVTRQPRRRAPSTSAPSDAGQASSTSSSNTIGRDQPDKETRRASMRGDESILTALKTSREGGDHPLSQSVTASPDLKDTSSYFQGTTAPFYAHPASAGGTPAVDVDRISRPHGPARAISALSTAESTRTVRALAPNTGRPTTPPPVTQGLPSTPSMVDASPAGLGGIFGGAGRRLAKSIRSRERRPSTERSPSARRVSMESDAHGEPSLAINTTSVAGEVHTPEVLRSPSPAVGRQPLSSPVHAQHLRRQSYHQPQESSIESFEQAQAINDRKYAREAAEAAELAASRPHSQASNDECPPSPDDETFYNKIVDVKSSAVQQQGSVLFSNSNLPSASTLASSSDDYLASGMSQSYSHPSIPSVVSGASSLSNEGYLAPTKEATVPDTNPVAPYLRTADTITASDKIPPLRQQEVYNDGDDEDDDSEDEGLSFGMAKSKPIGKM